MSTSLLVTKMNQAAKAQGLDYEIAAYPVADVEKVASGASIILLGPQVRFEMAKLRESLPCPVETIDMAAYGMMDGAAVIKQVRAAIGD